MFLDDKVNGGEADDFEHEVPVADILPAQKAMIHATFKAKQKEIKILLGIDEEDTDEEQV